MSYKLIVAFIIILLSSSCHGENILFFLAVSTYSHRITVWPLVEALVDKGHSVTFLQPYKNKNPHEKVIEIIPNVDKISIDFIQMRHGLGPGGQAVLLGGMLPVAAPNMCKKFLNDPQIIEWINSTITYDLVIIDSLLNDCALGLAYKWKAKTIIFGMSSAFEWWPDTFGFPPESSWIPNLHSGYLAHPVPLTFFHRILPTLAHLYLFFSKSVLFHQKVEPILSEKLNLPDMPKLSELESNVSLVFVNSHFSEEYARSLPPLIVPVGGIQCTDKIQPLPKEMEDFINKTGEVGFIYVSFGSLTNFNTAAKKVRDAFFNAFRNVKMQFLWKWEGPRPEDMPSNVYTADWMPQQDILGHPKIRCFITHGGLLSMHEAIFHGVPMISFPIFADQDYNAERIHQTERGIRLEITSVTQTEIEDAITSILTDDRYLNNVKKTSVLFKDRPQKPLDTAIWWVEYVLRHKDTSHLRPLAISQTWYERRLLDVWTFIFVVFLLYFGLCIFILKKLVFYCLKGTTIENNDKVKQC